MPTLSKINSLIGSQIKPTAPGVVIRPGRSYKGSMLSLSALVTGIIILAFVIGIAGYLLLAQQKRGQNQVDQFCLQVAQVLNDSDKIGQMNNVVARCRELVYVSRMNNNQAVQAGGILTPLAEQLLNESRDSAVFVENERQKELGYIMGQVQDAVNQYNVNTKPTATFQLPYIQTFDANVQEVQCGYLDKVQSNVLNLQVIPPLKDFDQQQGYFEAGSNLYKGNINALLPGPDNDLNFKLSSLPADFNNTTAPSRLANPEVFRSFGKLFEDGQYQGHNFDQLPSAINLTATMQVSLKQNLQQVRINSTAQTNGGMPAP